MHGRRRSVLPRRPTAEADTSVQPEPCRRNPSDNSAQANRPLTGPVVLRAVARTSPDRSLAAGSSTSAALDYPATLIVYRFSWDANIS